MLVSPLEYPESNLSCLPQNTSHYTQSHSSHYDTFPHRQSDMPTRKLSTRGICLVLFLRHKARSPRRCISRDVRGITRGMVLSHDSRSITLMKDFNFEVKCSFC